MNAAFISIVLISIILAGWTGYAFVSQSTKSNQIIKVVQDMYENQKSVVTDIIKLSQILLKDSTVSITSENEDLFFETKSLPDQEDNYQLNESLIHEDNGDNPLGIVIEESLPELSDNTLSEIIKEPSPNENSDFIFNEMKMEMN